MRPVPTTKDGKPESGEAVKQRRLELQQKKIQLSKQDQDITTIKHQLKTENEQAKTKIAGKQLEER